LCRAREVQFRAYLGRESAYESRREKRECDKSEREKATEEESTEKER
jgi:hypothetical protein